MKEKVNNAVLFDKVRMGRLASPALCCTAAVLTRATLLLIRCQSIKNEMI